jgi:chromosome segregation ATPase
MLSGSSGLQKLENYRRIVPQISHAAPVAAEHSSTDHPTERREKDFMAEFNADDATAKESTPEEKEKELRAQINQLEAKLAESQEEAELCLLQLHQVQEELEHYFLRCSDLEAKISALGSENKSALEKEQRDFLRFSDLEAKISALESENKSAFIKEKRLISRLCQSEQLLSKAMKYISSIRQNSKYTKSLRCIHPKTIKSS